MISDKMVKFIGRVTDDCDDDIRFFIEGVAEDIPFDLSTTWIQRAQIIRTLKAIESRLGKLEVKSETSDNHRDDFKKD